MSLLIKALEKAARERQEKAAQDAAGMDANGLALEPMLSAADDGLHGLDATAGAEQQRQAASAFVAAAAPARGLVVVDYLRERPLIAFYIIAALFAIGYGTFVYLEISHPALFIARATPRVPVTAHAPAAPANSDIASRPQIGQRQAPVPSATPRPTAAAQPAATTGSVALALPTSMAPAPLPSTATAPVSTTPHRTAAQAAPRRDTAVAPAVGETAQHAALEQPRHAFAEAQRRRRRAARALTSDTPPASAASSSLNGNTVKVTPGGPAPTINPLLTRAYGAYESGDYHRALNLYRRVVHAEPLNTDALLGLAAVAAQTGNEKEAARSYGRALDIDPQNALAQAGLINLAGRSDPDAAETRLKTLLARTPSAFVYFALGNVYAGEGRWADAQEAYFHAYHRQPDDADYAYNLAVGLEHLGQSRPALHFYRRAVQLAGSGAHIHFNVAAAQTQITRLAAGTE